MSKFAVIHCQPAMEDFLKKTTLNWSYNDDQDVSEIDVIVPDVEYTVADGYYQDPDEQLCEHYGIDYNLVNCIEAI